MDKNKNNFARLSVTICIALILTQCAVENTEQLKVTNSFLGQMRSTSICPQCKGYGKVVDKIPAGAVSYTHLRAHET